MVAVLYEFSYISLFINTRQIVEKFIMRLKLLAMITITMSLMLTACGDDGGAADGKWVGEVYASAKTKSSTIVGEFDSYEECVAETQKQAKSGVFNCGIK